MDEIRRDPGRLGSLANGVNRLAVRAENPVSKVEFGEASACGNVFAFDQLRNEPGFDKSLNRALRSIRGATNTEALIKAMVFYRLCVPNGEFESLEWLETVAILDVLRNVECRQMLRSMDALMKNVERVEERFAKWIRPLIDVGPAIAFFDFTTVRMGGAKEREDDLFRLGNDREMGGVVKLFALGVVQTAEGLSLAHMVHSDIVADTKMASALLERFSNRRIVQVADLGLTAARIS